MLAFSKESLLLSHRLVTLFDNLFFFFFFFFFSLSVK